MPATHPPATTPMPATPAPEPKPPVAPPEGLSPAGSDEFDVLVDSQFVASERSSDAGREPAPRGTPGATPHAWQFGLIALLAKLESLRYQFAGCRYAADADHLLDRIEAMVLLTEEFSRLHDFPDASMETQMNALAKAGTFYAALNDTRHAGPVSRSLFKSMVSKASPLVPGAAVRECLSLGIETLHAHFSLFTEMYRSSIKARNWVDAASSFLADFKQMARAIPEG